MAQLWLCKAVACRSIQALVRTGPTNQWPNYIFNQLPFLQSTHTLVYPVKIIINFVHSKVHFAYIRFYVNNYDAIIIYIVQPTSQPVVTVHSQVIINPEKIMKPVKWKIMVCTCS